MENSTAPDNTSTPQDLPQQAHITVDNVDESKWKWRKVAKVTGYINMIAGSIGFVYIAIDGSLWSYDVIKLKQGNVDPKLQAVLEHVKPVNENVFHGIVLSLLLLAATVFILDVWAGRTMIMATSKSSDIRKCLDKFKTWRNLNVALVLLSCTLIPGGYRDVSVWMWLAYRFTCFRLGALHLWELQDKFSELNDPVIKYSNTPQDIHHSDSFRQAQIQQS